MSLLLAVVLLCAIGWLVSALMASREKNKRLADYIARQRGFPTMEAMAEAEREMFREAGSTEGEGPWGV